jgi:MSHA biogenesis protein MshG
MQTAIEHGVSFTNAISKMELFTPLEVQILAVGEKNGELSPALDFISNFHNHEIQYDLKRLSDMIGPIMLAIVAGLVLIIALGVYLPIWNMINLKH